MRPEKAGRHDRCGKRGCLGCTAIQLMQACKCQFAGLPVLTY